MEPAFFARPEEFRAWLEKHHDTAAELIVGFHKKGSGLPSITWPESVDQALCFGWIDGVRRSLGETSYTIRFTPRKPSSNWSAVNVARVAELERLGLMTDAGRAAFARRRDDRTAIYAFEQTEEPVLPAEYERRLRADPAAWEYFSAQPPGYRRLSIFRVVSAKREDTRERRLERLIDASRRGERTDRW